MLQKLLIVIFFTGLIFSTPANEKGMKSKSLSEFHQFIRIEQNEKKIKTLCLLQLKRKKIPTYCYRWLKNQNSRKKKPIWSYLNEKCLEFSKNLKNLEYIEHVLQNFFLPPTCQIPLQNKKRNLEYQLRDQAPKKLLKWYFKSQF